LGVIDWIQEWKLKPSELAAFEFAKERGWWQEVRVGECSRWSLNVPAPGARMYTFSMHTCDGCTRDFKTIQGLRGHQQMGCSGRIPKNAGVFPVKSQAEADTIRDREWVEALRESYNQIRELEGKVTNLTAELASTKTHTHLGDIISHADTACEGCRRDMLAYDERVITNAQANAQALIQRFNPFPNRSLPI